MQDLGGGIGRHYPSQVLGHAVKDLAGERDFRTLADGADHIMGEYGIRVRCARLRRKARLAMAHPRQTQNESRGKPAR